MPAISAVVATDIINRLRMLLFSCWGSAAARSSSGLQQPGRRRVPAGGPGSRAFHDRRGGPSDLHPRGVQGPAPDCRHAERGFACRVGPAALTPRFACRVGPAALTPRGDNMKKLLAVAVLAAFTTPTLAQA